MIETAEFQVTETNETEKPTAGEIIAKYQMTAPVNVVGIARDLGIRVWEMHNLPEGVSGQIWPDRINGGTSGYSIGVRASEPISRKRFTVAHEVAHFVLHRNKLNGGLYEDVMFRGGLSTHAETEANQMAAAVLMPFDLISKVMDEGADTLDKIADRLQVSRPALRIRLGSQE